MKIETFGKSSVFVSVNAGELCSCGVRLDDMSIIDPPTRRMLGDLLALIGDMGLRRKGERVYIDCVEGADGGCVLIFNIRKCEQFRFAGIDELISAAVAGALPKDAKLERDGKSWVFTPEKPLTEAQSALLLEFCED